MQVGLKIWWRLNYKFLAYKTEWSWSRRKSTNKSYTKEYGDIYLGFNKTIRIVKGEEILCENVWIS